MDTKILERKITEVVREEGFKRKGQSWYVESQETVCVLNLQKYGGWHFINLGVLVKHLDDIPFPKEYQCHLRIRLCRLFPTEEEFHKYLNFEDEAIPADHKVERICDAIKYRGLPTLLSCTSLQGIKDLLQGERRWKFAVNYKLQELLNTTE